MKRNTYYILMMLFILAACAPIPEGLGQAATATQEATSTIGPTSAWTPEPTPSPTPDEIKLRNIISKEDLFKFSEFSRITFKDFTSGKLLELERKWLDENPFSENAVPFSTMKFKEGSYIAGNSTTVKPENYIFEIDTKMVLFQFNKDYSDPSTRPVKVISYYVLWDEELFKSLEITDKVLEDNYMFGVEKENKFAKLGIMSWAWLNPDGSTVIGHTLVDFTRMTNIEGDQREINFPVVDTYNYREYIPDPVIHATRSIMEIYSLYPELNPLELSEEWVNKKIMPKEMESKLFGYSNYSQKW